MTGSRSLRCRTARQWLTASHDGELPVARQVTLDAHLEACGDCRRLRRDLTAISGALREHATEHRPNEPEYAGLGSRVLESLPAGSCRPLPRRLREAVADGQRLCVMGGVIASMLVAGLFTAMALSFSPPVHPHSLSGFLQGANRLGSNANPLRGIRDRRQPAAGVGRHAGRGHVDPAAPAARAGEPGAGRGGDPRGRARVGSRCSASRRPAPPGAPAPRVRRRVPSGPTPPHRTRRSGGRCRASRRMCASCRPAPGAPRWPSTSSGSSSARRCFPALPGRRANRALPAPGIRSACRPAIPRDVRAALRRGHQRSLQADPPVAVAGPRGLRPRRLAPAQLPDATAGLAGRQRRRSVGSRPSRGAPVPDEPMKNLLPSSNVTSRPLARALRSLLW